MLALLHCTSYATFWNSRRVRKGYSTPQRVYHALIFNIRLTSSLQAAYCKVRKLVIPSNGQPDNMHCSVLATPSSYISGSLCSSRAEVLGICMDAYNYIMDTKMSLHYSMCRHAGRLPLLQPLHAWRTPWAMRSAVANAVAVPSSALSMRSRPCRLPSRVDPFRLLRMRARTPAAIAAKRP